MKAPSKEHMTMYGPIYAVLTLVLGGGGVATITDNIPVTTGEFRKFMEIHNEIPHPVTATRLTENKDAIEAIQSGLDSIRLEQTREQLKHAYEVKCQATGAGLEYIDREITRLSRIFLVLSGREYDPPPCAN